MTTTEDVESISDLTQTDIVIPQGSENYGEEVTVLEERNKALEEEVKRLSTQVLQLSSEKDAFETHAKRLGETLKQVRLSAEEHHVPKEDLGVDLQRSFSIEAKDLELAKSSADDEEHAQLSAVKLVAQQNGWFVDPSELKLGKKIGEGATADIFLAEWHGLEVAVKCLRKSYITNEDNAVENFLQEAELLVRQRHPYVLRLFGACFEYPSKCWIISEVLSNGTLTEWLHGDKGRQWSRKIPLPPLVNRIRIALEISLAMQYLHEQNPIIIHRDLKPSNIFIDSAFHVRVADFGFARYLRPQDKVMTGETGTYMYMAPEVIKHEKYDHKCDVYSFGVMLCELLTGNPPFIETYLTPMQMAVGVADGSLRPKLPTGVDSSLVSLVTTSWAHDRSKRPSFADISTVLKSHLKALMKPAVEVPVKDGKGGLFSFMHTSNTKR